MDEWVSADHINLATVDPPEMDETGKKRKKSDGHDSDAEGHEGFDEAAIREHEEFTKVTRSLVDG